MERRVKERRRRDRVTNWITRGSIAALVIFNIVGWRALQAQQDEMDQSRVNITYRACREQNDRHDQTLARLNNLVSALPAPERKRAERNSAGSKALIETLTPHQDCRALVRHRFGEDAQPQR